MTTRENAFDLASKVSRKVRNGRHQHILQLLHRRDVHRSREGVVGRLAVIHVVIRMDRLLRSHHSAGQLDRAVRDHFIGVHVGLGSGSGLEYHQWKLGVQLSVDNLLRRADDQIHFVMRQLAQFGVRQRRALLQDAERADHGPAPAVVLDYRSGNCGATVRFARPTSDPPAPPHGLRRLPPREPCCHRS